MSERLAVAVLAAALVLSAVQARRALAARSLVPRALDATLEERRIGREKHPGRDDRYFLALRDAAGRRFEVEVTGLVFDSVAPGERLRKRAGSSTLEAGGRRVDLAPDPAAAGLARALWLAVGPPLLLLLWRAVRYARGA